MIKLLIENQLRKIRRTWDHFIIWVGFQPQLTKSKRGRKKGIKKESQQFKHPEIGTSSQKTFVVQTRSQKWVEKTYPSVPQLPKFYTRRSDRIRKAQQNPPPTETPYNESLPKKI